MFDFGIDSVTYSFFYAACWIRFRDGRVAWIESTGILYHRYALEEGR